MRIKAMALLGIFAWSAVAAAYPEIGDRVEFEGDSISREGEFRLIGRSQRVTDFDRVEQRWLVEVADTGSDYRRIHTERPSGLFRPEDFQEMMSECQERGGQVETITVPAGEFETCHLVTAVTSDLLEETWYGDIPFGIVKKIETNFAEGRKDTLSLTEWESARSP